LQIDALADLGQREDDVLQRVGGLVLYDNALSRCATLQHNLQVRAGFPYTRQPVLSPCEHNSVPDAALEQICGDLRRFRAPCAKDEHEVGASWQGSAHVKSSGDSFGLLLSYSHPSLLPVQVPKMAVLCIRGPTVSKVRARLVH